MTLSAMRPTRLGGHRAQRDAGDDGEQERCEGKQQGRRQPFQDQPGDRPSLAERRAQVAVQHVVQVERKLGGERLVQAELCPQLRHQLRIGGARLRRR